MEVATAVLYLQAALEETDTAEEQMVARARRLADRLDSVSAGGTRAAGTLDGGAVPARQRQPDHGQRGG